MLNQRFSERGVQCPVCGWLGPAGESRCPVEGADLVELEDMTDAAIELALQQSAELLAVQHEDEALAGDGGIAALLRF